VRFSSGSSGGERQNAEVTQVDRVADGAGLTEETVRNVIDF
jgi:hypothetical protein